MKKIIFKKSLGFKPNNPKRNIKYIKDKSVRQFLIQHLRPINIDFSQVKSCLLFQMANEENAIDILFPANTKRNNTINSQLNINRTLFN